MGTDKNAYEKFPVIIPVLENGATNGRGTKDISGRDRYSDVYMTDYLLCFQVGLFSYISVYVRLNFQLVSLKGLHNPIL